MLTISEERHHMSAWTRRLTGWARKLNNLNGSGWAQRHMNWAGLQAKLYPKFAYKTTNHKKVIYAISA